MSHNSSLYDMQELLKEEKYQDMMPRHSLTNFTCAKYINRQGVELPQVLFYSEIDDIPQTNHPRRTIIRSIKSDGSVLQHVYLNGFQPINQ